MPAYLSPPRVCARARETKWWISGSPATRSSSAVAVSLRGGGVSFPFSGVAEVIQRDSTVVVRGTPHRVTHGAA